MMINPIALPPLSLCILCFIKSCADCIMKRTADSPAWELCPELVLVLVLLWTVLGLLPIPDEIYDICMAVMLPLSIITILFFVVPILFKFIKRKKN